MITGMHVVPKGGPHYYTRAHKLYRFQSNGLIEGQKGTQESDPRRKTSSSVVPYIIGALICYYSCPVHGPVVAHKAGPGQSVSGDAGGFLGGIESFVVHTKLLSPKGREKVCGFCCNGFQTTPFPRGLMGYNWWGRKGREGKGRCP